MYSKYFVFRHYQIYHILVDCIFMIITSDYNEKYKDIILVKSNFIAGQNECDEYLELIMLEKHV